MNVNRNGSTGSLSRYNWQPATHVTDPILAAVCGALVKFNTDMDECEGFHPSIHIRLNLNYHVSYVSLMYRNTMQHNMDYYAATILR